MLYLRLFTFLSLSCFLYPHVRSLIYLLYLSVCASFLHAFSALFLGVLEKTVEGEATALTKAKTLYKSCTNERKSAGIRCKHRLFLFIYLHAFPSHFFYGFTPVIALAGAIMFSSCLSVHLSFTTNIYLDPMMN